MERHRLAVGPEFGWTNAYVLASGTTAIVLDPGRGSEEWVREIVAAYGYDVGAMLLTHGHMDHTWDAAPLAAWFGCVVALHPAGHEFLERPERALPDHFPRELLADHPRTRPRNVVRHDSVASVGNLRIDVVATPGHTACSVSYRISDDETSVLVSGDTLIGPGVPGSPVAPTGDPDALASSVRVLAAEAETVDVVLPGHGPEFVRRPVRRKGVGSLSQPRTH